MSDDFGTPSRGCSRLLLRSQELGSSGKELETKGPAVALKSTAGDRNMGTKVSSV